MNSPNWVLARGQQQRRRQRTHKIDYDAGTFAVFDSVDLERKRERKKKFDSREMQKRETCQRDENDVAKEVVVCYPAPSKKIGMLHPISSLYEKPIGTKKTKQCMSALTEMLQRLGVKTTDVCDALACTAELDVNVRARLDLEDLASKSLTYAIAEPADVFTSKAQLDRRERERRCEADSELALKLNKNRANPSASSSSSSSSSSGASLDRMQSAASLSTLMAASLSESAERVADARLEYYVSEEYKRTVLAELSTKQLVEIVLTRPTVTIRHSARDTGFAANYSFAPLSNLLFTRDQQITTERGIVMGRPASAQRALEVDVMQFVFNKLGYRVAGRVPDIEGMTLEGGDYIPAGDIAFIGVGLRTSLSAVEWLLEHDLIGARRVAVVFDNFERAQERMHLDCVFNICSKRTCVMLEDMMGDASPTRRLVDEWVRADDGTYTRARKDVEFSRYVADQSLTIIPVSGQEQLEYGCNCLNLGDGRVIAVQQEVARRIARHPDFDGTVSYLEFEGVTALFGAVHCATQVVYRAPSKSN
jgi:arginine deiminase